jgi:non-heme chloroperoxidase
VFDQIRGGVQADRAQFFRDFAVPFFGFNRPGAKVSQGLLDGFLMQSLAAGLVSVYDCIKAFGQTDFTEDLKRFDIPTLILHGDDDQVVPIAISAMRSSKIVKDAELKVYPGLPHGMCATHKDQINADLLEFIGRSKTISQTA